MKKRTETIPNFGYLAAIEGENMIARIEFDSVDLARAVEFYLPIVSGNKKQEDVAKAFLSLLRKKHALFSMTVPFPAGSGYDVAKGRYIVLDGVRYDNCVIPPDARWPKENGAE